MGEFFEFSFSMKEILHTKCIIFNIIFLIFFTKTYNFFGVCAYRECTIHTANYGFVRFRIENNNKFVVLLLVFYSGYRTRLRTCWVERLKFRLMIQETSKNYFGKFCDKEKYHRIQYFRASLQ
jgi:hypothetical protein